MADTATPALRRLAAATLAVLALALAPAARAQTWNEVGDAGDLVSSAQLTVGLGPLTTLNGQLGSPTDVDVYCIQLDTTPRVVGLPVVALQCLVMQGPNVWVFDANGMGIATNATCQFGSKVVTTTTLAGPGTYYIAVSYYGLDPASGANPIWLPAVFGERTPDGPGAPGPLTGWAGSPTVQPQNPYQITLTYATYCDAATPAATPTWGALKLHYGL